MLFNVAFLTFMAFFSVHLCIVCSAGNVDSHIRNSLSREDGTADSSDTSSSLSVKTKRLRDELFNTASAGLSNAKRFKIKPQKYHNRTHPITPLLNDNLVKNLREWEKEIIPKRETCVWQNFNDLKDEDVKTLCVEAWKVVKHIPDILLKNDVLPDCDPVLIHGPSEHSWGFRSYKGYFQYVDEMKDKVFFPDLVRCNCAFLRFLEKQQKYVTIDRSKRFFFLLKHTENVFFILTAHGAANAREVKIVDVLEIK